MIPIPTPSHPSPGFQDPGSPLPVHSQSTTADDLTEVRLRHFRLPEFFSSLDLTSSPPAGAAPPRLDSSHPLVGVGVSDGDREL